MKNRINLDLTQAVKSGDHLRRDVLRMLKSRILEAEVALRESRGRDYELSSDEVQQVVVQYAKQRRQSIDSYQQAGRSELAEKEIAELEILGDYLPRTLDTSEIEALVAQVILEIGAAGPADMGRVMKSAMARLQGAADGKVVSQIVRQKLSAG